MKKLITFAYVISVVELFFAQNPTPTCFQADNNYVFQGAFFGKSIAKADFNHDGKLDVVSGSFSGAISDQDATLLYYTQNNGNRSFAPTVQYKSGARVLDIAAADIDGNGNTDVVVLNVNLNRLAVIFGNGDGTFQSNIVNNPFTSNILGNAFALGDFNGDGKLDAVTVGNSTIYVVSINTGIAPPANVFTHTEYSLANGGVGSDVVVNDFNNDSKLDFAIANSTNSTVEIYLGNGNGTFTYSTTTTLIANSQSVSIKSADLNHDGKPDLVVVNQYLNTISVILNSLTGFPSTPNYNYTVGQSPTNIDIGDINSDGEQDLLVTNANDNNISIFLGVGNGSFNIGNSVLSMNNPQNITLGDFDGDGILDIFVSTQIGGAIPASWGYGNGTFVEGKKSSTGNSPQELAIGDIDGDGNPDMVIANKTDNTVGIYTSDGNGNYIISNTISTPSPSSVVLGDFFGNSRQDLLVSNYSNGTVSIFQNNGTGLPNTATSTVTVGSNPIRIRKGDANADSNLDLFVINEADQISILTGNNNGTFNTPTVISTGAGSQPVDIAISDANGDGFDDFAVACYGTSKALFFKNTGTGYNSTATITLTTSNGPKAIAFGEYGWNSAKELLVACYDANKIDFFLGNTTATVYSTSATYKKSFTSGETGPMSITTGDFNNDGKLDFAASNFVSSASTGNVTIFLGTGNYTLPSNANSAFYYGVENRYSVGINPIFVTSGNLDNNSCIDLAVVNQNSKYVSLMLNSSCGNPTITASGPTTICPGSSVVLTASSAAEYLWSNGAKTQSITVNSAGTYSVTTATGSCSGTSTNVTVTIDPGIGCGANANFTLSPNSTSICVGSSITFSDNSTGNIISYDWNFDGAAPSETTVGPHTITFNNSGIYHIQLEVGDGTTTDDTTVVITVNALPTVNTSGVTTICSGTSTNLSASGTATNYSWSDGVSTIGTNATQTVSPTAQTTYIVTGTDGNGCQDTAHVIVHVNSLPTVTASSDVAVCSGTSTNLSASGTATNYSWSDGVTTIGTGTPLSVNPTATTTYTVTGTDGIGCTGTDQVTVTVNALPTVSAGTNTSVCAGSSTTLTATGATSYLWDDNSTSATRIVSPSTATTYSVTGTDGNGCQNTANVLVSVVTVPAVIATGTAAICSGTTTTISATGASTYSWSDGVTNVGTGSSLNVSPTTTTTYTVTGTVSGGCQNTAQVTVTVNSLPTVNAGTYAAICQNDNVAMTATGTALSYKWYEGTTLIGSSASLTVTPTATTTYTVIGKDANLCQDTAQTTITVNALPTVSAGVNTSVCAGSSTTLTATGATSYLWDDNSTSATRIVSPSTATTYSVTGTDINGCKNTASVMVSVNASPTVNASGATTVCSGTSANLSVSGTATNYSWSDGVSTIGTNATQTVSPTAQTTYIVTGTDGNGCQDTAHVIVHVNSLPTVTVSSDVAVCTGIATTLSVSGTATNYSWSDGVTTIGTGTPLSVNPTATTTYTVTGTDGVGCTGTDQVTVTVNALPVVSAGSNTSVCQGTSTTLTATGATSYLWDDNSNNAIRSVTPTVQTTYSVTGTDGNGCKNTASVMVSVNASPTVTTSGATTICSGTSTNLSASGTATSYSWSDGVSTIGTGTPLSVNPTATTTYTVIGTDLNGCQEANQVVVTVRALPTINAYSDTSVCIGSPVTIYANGGVSYTWDNGLGIGASRTFSPTTTKTYTVTGKDVFNCKNTDQVTVTVYQKPIINAGLDVAICKYDSITIGAVGGLTYSWDNSLGVGDSQIVSPLITTTYTVTGIDVHGCQNTDHVKVTVRALPTISVSNNDTICAGSTAIISATGATSYLWDNGVGTGWNHHVSPNSTTIYTVIGNNSYGCKDTAQVKITVVPKPNSGFTSLAYKYCSSEESIPLVPIEVGGSFSATSGLTNNVFIPQLANLGKNIITYTISNGVCTSTTNDTVFIVKAPVALTPIIQSGGILTEPDLNLGESYQWFACHDNSPVIGETGKEFIPTSNGIYGVIISNGAGCSDTSDCVFWYWADTKSTVSTLEINVYPNPSTGKFTIDVNTDVDIEIIDGLGKLIYKDNIKSGKNYIDIGNFVEYGSYIVKFTDNFGNSTYRNIVVVN